MANRRMFSLSVVDTDHFLDMPATARLLFYDLGMRADDDGFLQNAQRIARTTGAGKDDLSLLVAKGYVIPFESGVYVIRHWGVNNQIRRDRHHGTMCVAEKALLKITPSGEYAFADDSDTQMRLPSGCQVVAELETEDRLVKDRVNSVVANAPPAKKSKRFIPPAVEEVAVYCEERHNGIDAQAFVDHYAASGWMRGKTPIRDWKACVRTWERNSQTGGRKKQEVSFDPYAGYESL